MHNNLHTKNICENYTGLSEREINFFYLFIYLDFQKKCLGQGSCPSGHFHQPFYKSHLVIYPFHWRSRELGILNSIPGHLFPKACPAAFAASESCANSCTNEKLHLLLAAQLLCFSAGFSPQTCPTRAIWAPSLFRRGLVATKGGFRDLHPFEKIPVMLQELARKHLHK